MTITTKLIKSLQRNFLVLACIFCTIPHTSYATQEHIIMGYWENWGTYQNYPMPNNAAGSLNAALNEQISGLTALSYAFLEIAADGSLVFSDAWSDLDPKSVQDQQFCKASPLSCNNFPHNSGLGNFTAFTKTKVSHHVISVGGAGHDDAWQHAFAHPDKFIATLKLLVDTYKIDWLDIDYEPIGGVPTKHIQSFIELTSKIKQSLPALKLSYAIPANYISVSNFGTANWQRLSSQLDYISIMGYDIHGSFDTSNPYTALHSALIAEEKDYSVEKTIQALNAAGVANQKIILGMPLYGRAVGGVAAPGLAQVFTEGVKGDLDDNNCSTNLTAWNLCGGMIQYKTLIDQFTEPTPVYMNGQLSGVYSYDAVRHIFISYDNPESAKAKSQYAIKNELAGVMLWALRFDKPYNHPKSVLKAIVTEYSH